MAGKFEVRTSLNKASIWQHQAFLDLFSDPLLSDETATAPPKDKNATDRLTASIALVYNFLCEMLGVIDGVVEGTEGVSSAVRNCTKALSDCSDVLLRLPRCLNDVAMFYDLLSDVVDKLNWLQVGEIQIFPTGWSKPDGTVHYVLVVLYRCWGGNTFSVAVINTGDGMEYHGVCPFVVDGRVVFRRNIALVIEDVPYHRVIDTSFWYFLWRLPTLNQADALNTLYGRLLPYLNNKPLMSNYKHPQTDWRKVPNLAGDLSFCRCVLETVHHALKCYGLTDIQADGVGVLANWMACKMMATDLNRVAYISSSEAALIRMACRQLARGAGEQTGLEQTASADRASESFLVTKHYEGIQQCIAGLEERVSQLRNMIYTTIATAAAAPGAPPELTSTNDTSRPSCAGFPLFGRLRRDVSVEELAGEAEAPPILLPVELSLIPDKVSSYHEVANALRNCVSLCQLLANQSSLIHDTYVTRVSLIQHLFISVIPLPLPCNRAETDTCFWNKWPMRYETQADLLRLLHLVTRHFTTAAFSLRITQAFDAVRILTMASVAAVADAILRVKACDLPSMFSLHYSGNLPAPVHPYGFDIGNFAVQSELLLFTSPQLAAVRTQVLDYFTQQLDSGMIREDHILFQFESSMQLGLGERNLFDQLCLHTAFPRSPEVMCHYLTGEDPNLIDNYPELGFFRDIVFTFKALMAPTIDALPPVRAWDPVDGKLHWSWCDIEGCFAVTAFRHRLNPILVHSKAEAAMAPQPVEDDDQHSFVRKILKTLGLQRKSKLRAPPSGADPSALVGKIIDSEDDILHLKDLPTFGGTLKARDTELLLQYLTVPYLRVPLVLQFFTDPHRIVALMSPELQNVLDACFFEPSLWQKTKTKKCPEKIPSGARDHLATPCGLLFNELQKSPQTIVNTLEQMLDRVLDKDTGRYNNRACVLILYVVRLVVRVEGFILFLVRHHDWRTGQGKDEDSWSGTGFRSNVRGLECSESTIAILKEAQTRLRSRLDTKVFQALEQWFVRAMADRSPNDACRAVGHLAYLCRNAESSELTDRSVSTLLIAQCFLRRYYRFDIEVESNSGTHTFSDGVKRSKEMQEEVDNSLGIPQNELFDVFQHHRVGILAWLDANPERRSKVMEAVLRVVSHCGPREKSSAELKARYWCSIDGAGCTGRFVPFTKGKPSSCHLEALKEEAKKEKPTLPNSSATPEAGWVVVGDDLPTTGMPSTALFQKWLVRTTQTLDTEVNCQLGEVTLNRNHLNFLGTWVNDLSPEFVSIFGRVNAKSVCQCVRVSRTVHREWLRLVGRRYDIQSWDKDRRSPKTTYSRKMGDLKAAERWIVYNLEPFRRTLLKDMSLYLPDYDCSNLKFVCLSGYLEDAADDSGPGPTLKEVVVFHCPPVVHIYDVVEYGRRFYRTLAFTSDIGWCLHDMRPTTPMPNPYLLHHHQVLVPHLVAGDARKCTSPAKSVILTRNLSDQLGHQTLIPHRFLWGLLPSALLKDYQFWQNEDESLMGCWRGHLQNAALLDVRLIRQGKPDLTGHGNSDAMALVTRYMLKPQSVPVDQLSKLADAHCALDNAYASGSVIVDKSHPPQTLLNLLAAHEGSALQAVANVFLRLCNLSEVLVWSETPIQNPDDNADIDVVEIPLLCLTFRARRVESSVGARTRLYCEQHAGLFISNRRDPPVLQLLSGIPNTLLLENEQQELFVLLSAAAKPVGMDTSHRATIPATDLIFDRNNAKWLSKLETRHYVYPVHSSCTFLFTKTFASALYLLLLRLLTNNYENAFAMIDTCVSDTKLSPEEQQIWDQYDALASDLHPDASACRLKLWYCTLGCRDNMPCTWSLAADMKSYYMKREHVSAACRLPWVMETTLLEQCESKQRIAHLANQYRILNLLKTNTSSESFKVSVMYPAQYKAHPAAHLPMFDSVQDSSCLERPVDFWTRNFSMVSYDRPLLEDIQGPACIKFLDRLMAQGLGLDGDLGFFFLYELMTGSLKFFIGQGDSSYNYGVLLLRMLPHQQTQQSGLLVSILRVLAINRLLVKDMPKFEDDRTMKTTVMLPGQGLFSVLVSQISKYLLENKKNVHWPPLESNFDRPKELFVHRTSITGSRAYLTPETGDIDCQLRQITNISPEDLHEMPFEIGIRDLEALAKTPMAPIGLDDFVVKRTLEDRGLPPVATELPLVVDGHRCAQGYAAKQIQQRLNTDMAYFADRENKGLSLSLKGMSEAEVEEIMRDTTGKRLEEAKEKLHELRTKLCKLMANDCTFFETTESYILAVVNGDHGLPTNTKGKSLQQLYGLRLLKSSRYHPTITFEQLVGLLLSSSNALWARLCPHLTPEQLQTTLSLVAVQMMVVNRVGHAKRCLSGLDQLLRLLQKVRDAPHSKEIRQTIVVKATTLAQTLACQRHIFQHSKAGEGDTSGKKLYLQYDPRFLTFEFTHNMILRESQVALIGRLVEAARDGQSLTHQMIMGAGKTCVVAPFLSMLLANGSNLVTQVVPHELLEFSRSVLRERFSAVVKRTVYTLYFDRFVRASSALHEKLQHARETAAVVVASPTSVKAIVLRFLEVVHLIDEERGKQVPRGARKSVHRSMPPKMSNHQVADLKEQAEVCVSIIKIFKSGVLLLDEVDLILHPLKSELHWPLGEKVPLDFTRPILEQDFCPQQSVGPLPGHGPTVHRSGIRWQIPMHLIDAVLYASGYCGPSILAIHDSFQTQNLLEDIRAQIQAGSRESLVQTTPHLVILQSHFYMSKLLPLLAKWMLLWLRCNRLLGLTDDEVLCYLLHTQNQPVEEATLLKVQARASEAQMKMLNLSRSWLQIFLPHVLSKINRVHYGLLTSEQLVSAMESDPHVPRSRKLLSVPFIGKDVPSRASEWSHPDILIGLTILAYRYEGLRLEDLQRIIAKMHETMDSEGGAMHKRRACKMYARWVEFGGGQVRGMPDVGRSSPVVAHPVVPPSLPESPHRVSPNSWDQFPDQNALLSLSVEQLADVGLDEIWPLEVIDPRDEEQIQVLFRLFRYLPHVIVFYLHEIVFPLTMEHAGNQLSASGQELGGDLLFPVRIGFSGTPSNLLPLELGECRYEKGDDAMMITTMTNPAVVSYRLQEEKWSVTGLLDIIAKADPPYHALIDTGALITGFSNLEVARYLLEKGIPTMEGVVFLDADDRRAVLAREGMRVVPLSQCFIPIEKRFTFYDQVHTTGIDIQQAATAVAALTLSKDMTLRDYTQGAYRMRQIGQGQAIQVLIIPEVARLISTEVGKASKSRPRPIPKETSNDTPKQVLEDVCTWLLINSMRTENIQFSLLCQQNLYNMWRKSAFASLIGQYESLFSNSGGENEKFFTYFLADCLDALRSRLDYSVDNWVPKRSGHAKKLRAMVKRYSHLLETSESRMLADSILNMLDQWENAAKIEGEGANEEASDRIDPASLHELNTEHVQEKEQEKEQEQEQEKEQEEEFEEEREVDDQYGDLKYSRDDEGPRAWGLHEIGRPVSGRDPFYPVSEFAVRTQMLRQPKPITFPPYLLMSRNHYRQNWTLKTYRRLKNVIMVMEWIPDWNKLEVQSVAPMLSDTDQRLLRRIVDLFDFSGTGGLDKNELKVLLKAIEVEISDEEIECLMSEIISNRGEPAEKQEGGILAPFLASPKQVLAPTTSWDDPNSLSAEEVMWALQTQRFYQIQKGRHFVVLSLAEAETLRSILHIKQGMPLLGNDNRTAIALRSLRYDNVIIDASEGFRDKAQPFSDCQQFTASQCLRFLESETEYNNAQLLALLRSLRDRDRAEREQWFQDVRYCRRRPQLVISTTQVSQLFTVKHEYTLLWRSAIMARVRGLLRSKKLSARDAFSQFDLGQVGVVPVKQLEEGLAAMGLDLENAENRLLNQLLDVDGYGLVTLQAFKKLLDPENREPNADEQEEESFLGWCSVMAPFRQSTVKKQPSGTDLRRAGSGGAISPVAVVSPAVYSPSPMAWEGPVERSWSDSLPLDVIGNFKMTVKPHTQYKLVWSSKDLPCRKDGSIWAPDGMEPKLLKKNTGYICVGHYTGNSHDPPAGACVLQITDTTSSGTFGSPYLQSVLEKACPYPLKFRRVWHKADAKGYGKPVYTWAAIPPSPLFVALGMVATTTADPPSITAIRCVPKAWTKESEKLAQLVWDDSGTSGQPGSLWQTNEMGLMAMALGHDLLDGPCYDMGSKEFRVTDENRTENQTKLPKRKGAPPALV